MELIRLKDVIIVFGFIITVIVIFLSISLVILLSFCGVLTDESGLIFLIDAFMVLEIFFVFIVGGLLFFGDG